MKRRLLLGFALAGLLGGCASGGNRVLDTVNNGDLDRQLMHGYATKADVRNRMGDPLAVSFTDSGNEIWRYEFTDVHATATSFIPVVNWFSSGVEGYRKELVVFFDKSGKVQNHSFNTSAIDGKHGIVRQ